LDELKAYTDKLTDDYAYKQLLFVMQVWLLWGAFKNFVAWTVNQKIDASYIVTFQLKSAWSRVFPKFGFHCSVVSFIHSFKYSCALQACQEGGVKEVTYPGSRDVWEAPVTQK